MPAKGFQALVATLAVLLIVMACLAVGFVAWGTDMDPFTSTWVTATVVIVVFFLILGGLAWVLDKVFG